MFGFIKKIFSSEKIDSSIIENLEDYLLSSDFGYETTQKIINELNKKNKDSSLTPTQTRQILKEQLESQLKPLQANLELTHKPTVLLFLGINGAGKTTVLAKIANYYKGQNKKILIGCADTFRASATEQLEEWANRLNIDYVSAPNSDPASVAYKTYKKAMEEGYDLALIDTAGRLTNNDNLMNELKKIYTTLLKQESTTTTVIPAKAEIQINKICHSHENGNLIDSSILPILVLDGTAGQNSVQQVENFSKIIPLSGLIINKLDSSSKAGFVFQLTRFCHCEEQRDVAIQVNKKINCHSRENGNLINKPLPIFFIGRGEKKEDLEVFTPQAFLKDF